MRFDYAVAFVLSLTTVLLVACGGGSGDDDTPADAGVDAAPMPAVATFTPPAPGTPIDWSKVPYPSDLFLDGTGHFQIGAFPTGPIPVEAAIQPMKDALSSLDGAGLWSNVYFTIEGALDPQSLAGNVHLAELKGGTLTEIAVDAFFRDDLKALVILPKFGIVLKEKAVYAAWATTSIKATNGTALARDEGFTIAANLASVPTDPGLAAAQNNLKPLIMALGADADKVAVATVFKTRTLTKTLKEMRDIVAAQAPAVSTVNDVLTTTELDTSFGPEPADHVPGMTELSAGGRGQPHQNVKAMLHATFGIKSFVAAAPNTGGTISLDSGGKPVVKGTHDVKFTIVLPKTASWANLPVVLYLHGIGRSRGDIMTNADSLTKRGYAVMSIDIPFHGDRVVAADLKDLVGDVTFIQAPDSFGDINGLKAQASFFDLGGGGTSIPRQAFMRANLLQSTTDLISLATFVRLGDLGSIKTALAAESDIGATLANSLSFRTDRVALASESFGSMLSIPALAVEPTITAAVASVAAGGFPWPALLHSALFSNLFRMVVYNPFDLAARVNLGDTLKGARVDPMVMFYCIALEEGDSVPWAQYVVGGPLRGDNGPNLLLAQVWFDETVPNEATEFVASMLGVPEIKLTQPMTTPDGKTLRFATLPTATAPLSGNVGGGNRTAAIAVWYPAMHAFLRQFSSESIFIPPFPVPGAAEPFPKRMPSLKISQPIVQFHAQIGAFFDAAFATGKGTIIDPYDN
jgi:hypothetical protein